MPIRKAKAEWSGDLLSGKGNLATETGSFNGQYSFSSRFEEGTGTNPEELIAAAHAGCYSMALSAGLAKGGYKPISVKTEDQVYIEKLEEGFRITKIVVNCEAVVEGIDEATFQTYAENTKNTCPVSKALTGTTFELNAKLVQ